MRAGIVLQVLVNDRFHIGLEAWREVAALGMNRRRRHQRLIERMADLRKDVNAHVADSGRLGNNILRDEQRHDVVNLAHVADRVLARRSFQAGRAERRNQTVHAIAAPDRAVVAISRTCR